MDIRQQQFDDLVSERAEMPFPRTSRSLAGGRCGVALHGPSPLDRQRGNGHARTDRTEHQFVAFVKVFFQVRSRGGTLALTCCELVDVDVKMFKGNPAPLRGRLEYPPVCLVRHHHCTSCSCQALFRITSRMIVENPSVAKRNIAWPSNRIHGLKFSIPKGFVSRNDPLGKV